MYIEKQFAPTKITIETKDDLEFFKDILRKAITYERGTFGGCFNNRSRSDFTQRAEALLRDIR